MVLALGCVLAVVALVVYSNHGASSDESDVASAARELRATAASSDRLHAGTSGAWSSGGGSGTGDLHGGTANRPRRGGERPSSGFGAPARPRLPDAITDGSRRGGEDVAEERGSIEGDEIASGQPLTGHDLPAAHGSAAQPGAAGAESDTMPENRPNVVYDGGDRVFDTTSRQQITDRRPITGDAGSISFWAQPQWESGNEDRASFVQIGENGLRIVKDGDFLRFEYTDAHGDNQLGGVADISNWQAGQWRYIAASWQGGALALYVDGQRMRLTTPTEPPPVQNDPRLYVGTVTADGVQAPPSQVGLLNVMNRALTAGEIAAIHQKGPPH